MHLLKKKYIIVLPSLFLLAIGILSAVFLSQRTTDTRQFAAGEEWELVGIHPFASTQSSAIGKMLSGLYPYQGKLFISYGDAGNNTGPVHVTHYNPTSNTFIDDYLLTSEETEIYRELNNKWYTPIIDRRGGSASYAVGEPWTSPTFTGADSEHAYDLNSLTGTDLWLSTSHGYGRIWRSLDSGATWSNVYTGGIGCQGSSAVRFRFIGVYKGKVYVQGHDINGSVSAASWCSHPQSKVFNGSTWSDGPDLLPNKNTDMGFKPVVFADKMVYRSYPYLSYIDATKHQNFYVFDGTTITTPFNKNIHDFTVDGTTLYVLAEDGSVSKTTDLATFTQAAVTAPSTARSIGVLGNYIYVGTTDSKLYKYPLNPATPTPTTAIPANGTWEPLGTHPQSATQPTAIGKSLRTLITYNDKIYAGYGDYGANTGPIAITPFDPTTNTFGTPFYSQTDALLNYREIEGNLYAPSTDSRADTADYAIGSLDGSFRDVNFGTTTHAYDMATLNGDLFLTGARGGSALVWRSTDNGSTWQDSLAAFKNISGSVWRFYFAGVLNGKLYVQMKNLNGSADTVSKVFDGTSWSDGPNMLPAWANGWRPIVFANKLLYVGYEVAGNLLAFDGTTYSLVPSPTGTASMWVYGMDIYNGELYILISGPTSSTNSLYKTSDLLNWTTLSTTIPSSIVSMAILDGTLYGGSTDSKIYKYTLVSTTPPASTPTLTNTPVPPTPTRTPTPLPPTTTPTQTPSPLPPTHTPTRTPTPIPPTNTPIPTNTPVPTSTGFSLDLLLHAIGNGGDNQTPGAQGNFSPVNPSRSITLSLFDQNGTEVQTQSGTINFNAGSGNFTGTITLPSQLQNGSYTIKLSSPRYLTRQVPGFITITDQNKTTTIPLTQTTLVVGDSNGDNAIDVLDFNIIRDCYSDALPPKDCSDPNKKLSADLNDDGSVNGIDLNTFIRNALSRNGD